MTGPARAHVHNWALAALIEKCEEVETKSEVARRAGFTPQVLGDLLAGRSAAQKEASRQRLADALKVDVKAITCWCSDRRYHHMPGASPKAATKPQRGTPQSDVRRRLGRLARELRPRVARQYRHENPVESPYDILDWALAEVEDIARRA